MAQNRPPINGAKLILALPQIHLGVIDEYVIAALVREGEYVVSTVATLDSPSWGQGYYFQGEDALTEAIRFAYQRAGLRLPVRS